VKTAAFTALALLAFAANSILTRLALGRHLIDAATFTGVRLAAGAVVLGGLTWLRAPSRGWQALRGRGWRGPVALFAYAAPFSLAYGRIGAAVGALILFGSVQLTMIGWGLLQGERPPARTWVGFGLGATGLGWLMLPAASRPDALGSALMVSAGVAWGAYSLLGRRTASDRLGANAQSFVGAALMGAALFAAAAAAGGTRAGPAGLALALVSGAVTSGLGYAVWYQALRGLTATEAAVAQLAVPVIAALAAVAFLGEHATPRLLVAGAIVLGGVALAIKPGRARPSPAKENGRPGETPTSR
jgi:drug/metabolite transporter (DMT)-like permease